MRDHDISQRRVCRLVGVDPKTVRRERPPDDPEVRKEMQAIASKRRRFGYRRIGVMLERKGMIMNHKKQDHLSIPKKSWASGDGGGANVRVDREHLCPWLCARASVGHWTPYPTRLAHPASSACWP